ncbi:MAG: PIN domain-containing protein [Candidatus Aenigmarchaeota archaeon]|nr:PIN domain-containing protein [Candidatus Aenigmarchaeota archaeon]
MYVTDTHSFLWFITKDDKLSYKAREVFRSCDNGETMIAIPSIVLLECMYICEKGKIELEFNEVIEITEDSLNYLTYPLDRELVIKSQNIKSVKDVHDKIIIATANILGAKLITKDAKVMESGLVETIW